MFSCTQPAQFFSLVSEGVASFFFFLTKVAAELRPPFIQKSRQSRCFDGRNATKINSTTKLRIGRPYARYKVTNARTHRRTGEHCDRKGCTLTPVHSWNLQQSCVYVYSPPTVVGGMCPCGRAARVGKAQTNENHHHPPPFPSSLERDTTNVNP